MAGIGVPSLPQVTWLQQPAGEARRIDFVSSTNPAGVALQNEVSTIDATAGHPDPTGRTVVLLGLRKTPVIYRVARKPSASRCRRPRQVNDPPKRANMPQPQPRRQNPAQHRRNNDLNRKTPAPRIVVMLAVMRLVLSTGDRSSSLTDLTITRSSHWPPCLLLLPFGGRSSSAAHRGYRPRTRKARSCRYGRGPAAPERRGFFRVNRASEATSRRSGRARLRNQEFDHRRTVHWSLPFSGAYSPSVRARRLPPRCTRR